MFYKSKIINCPEPCTDRSEIMCGLSMCERYNKTSITTSKSPICQPSPDTHLPYIDGLAHFALETISAYEGPSTFSPSSPSTYSQGSSTSISWTVKSSNTMTDRG